jgi:hypothetical protein
MRKAIKILGITTIVCGAILAAAVVHIATLKPKEMAHWQIGRIDVKGAEDPIAVQAIAETVKRLPGVKQEVITNKNAIVYYYDNRSTEASKVLTQINKQYGNIAASFNVPSTLANASVCPVMDPNSITGKFTKLVQNIFNN